MLSFYFYICAVKFNLNFVQMHNLFIINNHLLLNYVLNCFYLPTISTFLFELFNNRSILRKSLRIEQYILNMGMSGSYDLES